MTTRSFLYPTGPSLIKLRDERCEWCGHITFDIEATFLPADGAAEWECGNCGRLVVTVLDLEDTDV